MPQSPNERKRAERARKRDAGLIRVEVYVHPRDAQAVQQYAARKRQRGHRQPVGPD